MMLKPETDTIFADREMRRRRRRRAAWACGPRWHGSRACLSLTSLFGFILALALFLFSLHEGARRASGSAVCCAYTAAGIAFMCVHGLAAEPRFPAGPAAGLRRSALAAERLT